jgi:serine/threonine-protein kinase HipA
VTTKVCAACLKVIAGRRAYHADCLIGLFGRALAPRIALTSVDLPAKASGMVGKMSISGAQEKVSLRLSANGRDLRVADRGGEYLLKPEPARWANLPQNEHLTMTLAARFGIVIPPCALVKLGDGATAYLVKRFDRLADGSKLRVEEFCQLAELPTEARYHGSAELCVRLLRKYASDPATEIAEFFRRLLFGWWVANGDMHLKNFALLTDADGVRRLSPAYDLVNTRLLIPDDEMALTLGGKHRVRRRKRWLDFAKFCEIPAVVADRMILNQIEFLDSARSIIDRSFLPDSTKERYSQIVAANTQILMSGS